MSDGLHEKRAPNQLQLNTVQGYGCFLPLLKCVLTVGSKEEIDEQKEQETEEEKPRSREKLQGNVIRTRQTLNNSTATKKKES